MQEAINYYRKFLEALGLDLKALGMEETPERVTKLYTRLFQGLEAPTKPLLGQLFTTPNAGMVAVGSIPYLSICEHHLTPFYGTVNIVYQPKDGLVAGLSKFKDLVKYYAARPQLQERLTTNIADAIMEILKPEGVMVEISAIQICMMTKEPVASKTYTLESRGAMQPGGAFHGSGLLLLEKIREDEKC